MCRLRLACACPQVCCLLLVGGDSLLEAFCSFAHEGAADLAGFQEHLDTALNPARADAMPSAAALGACMLAVLDANLQALPTHSSAADAAAAAALGDRGQLAGMFGLYARIKHRAQLRRWCKYVCEWHGLPLPDEEEDE